MMSEIDFILVQERQNDEKTRKELDNLTYL